MKQALPDSQTSWLFKFCESALAATALLNLLSFPLEFMPTSFFEKYGRYFEYVLIGLVVMALLFSLIYVWVWNRRERSANIYSELHHAWLQGIIRAWLAFSISTYGFAKILKTQFQTADYRLDMPLSSFDGMSLTWYYFGYSYPMTVIIALFQIGGSVLLLYRRTTFLGVMLLLPVMVNIILINIFYKITLGAFFNSFIYLLALVFLLMLHAQKLKMIFWDLIDHIPAIPFRRSWVKNSLRLLLIAAAFVCLKVAIATHPYDQTLKGTWTVKNLIRNGQVQPATAWLTDHAAWNRVYFAGYEGCAFSPNPYRFEPTESLLGSYEFDSLKNTLLVVFYSHDTLRATIRNRTAEAMLLHGVLGRDTLEMQLARLHR